MDMLALTDSALVRSPSATRKKRAYRRRQRDGAIVLGCEVREHDFATALLASRRLDERQALCRDHLARAAEEILREFTRRWLAHNQ